MTKKNNWKTKTNELLEKRILTLDTLVYAMRADVKIYNFPNKSLVITCMDQIKDNKYQLLHHGSLICFSEAEKFIAFILREIPKVQRVYLSYGPTAADIHLVYTDEKGHVEKN